MRARGALPVAAALSVLALPALPQGLWGDHGWEDAVSVSDADVNRGRFVALGGVFAEGRIDCVRCHGLDGAGDSSGAFPRLTGQGAWYLYKTLQDYATRVRPNEIMSPVARSLSERDIRDVGAYYAAVSSAPYPPTEEVGLETAQLGGAIAAVGISEQGVPSCASCHGAKGVGDPPVVPYLAGQFAAYTERQLLLWKAGERGGDPLNVMARIAQAMTEEQIRAVALYYSAVRPERVMPDAVAHSGEAAAPTAGQPGEPPTATVERPRSGGPSAEPPADAPNPPGTAQPPYLDPTPDQADPGNSG
jgi:cytochrome c553